MNFEFCFHMWSGNGLIFTLVECVGSVKVLTCCFDLTNFEDLSLASDFIEALHEMVFEMCSCKW